MSRLATWPLGLPTVMVVFGCSSPTYHTVSGVVRLDGRPLAHVSVIFNPDGPGKQAVGLTDAAGRFKLETDNVQGVLPGNYLVTIVENPRATDSASQNLDHRNQMLKTGLKKKIPSAGPEAYDLELTSGE